MNLYVDAPGIVVTSRTLLSTEPRLLLYVSEPRSDKKEIIRGGSEEVEDAPVPASAAPHPRSNVTHSRRTVPLGTVTCIFWSDHTNVSFCG
jgi:hypothetical protein